MKLIYYISILLGILILISSAIIQLKNEQQDIYRSAKCATESILGIILLAYGFASLLYNV